MTNRIRDVISAVFLRWTQSADSKPPTEDLLASLAAAGLAIYDTSTHAAVPRRLTRRMAEAIDVAPLADDGSLEEAWQPTWDAGIAAAEAEAKGGE